MSAPRSQPPPAARQPAAPGTPPSLGLRPRPGLPGEVAAVIAAAVEETWPRPVAFADEKDPAHAVWRFSGRWWNKPVPLRRERPFAQR